MFFEGFPYIIYWGGVHVGLWMVQWWSRCRIHLVPPGDSPDPPSGTWWYTWWSTWSTWMPAASTIHSQARPPRLVQKLHNYCFYGFLPSLPDHDYVWYVTPCYQTYMSDSKGDSDSGWTLQWEIWSHWDAALLTDTTNVELFNEENGVLVASTCFHIAFDEWNSIVLPITPLPISVVLLSLSCNIQSFKGALNYGYRCIVPQ